MSKNTSDESSEDEFNEEELQRNFDDEASLIVQTDTSPKKSSERYLLVYDAYKDWQKEHAKSLSNSEEKNLIVYFSELKLKLKPTTLWSIWSMLKKTLATRDDVNINNFITLKSLIKNNSKGYKPTKSAVLKWDEIKKFMNEAPDFVYLGTKVVLVFGICGALRSDEIKNMLVQDVEDLNNKKSPITSHFDESTSSIPCMSMTTSKNHCIQENITVPSTSNCEQLNAGQICVPSSCANEIDILELDLQWKDFADDFESNNNQISGTENFGTDFVTGKKKIIKTIQPSGSISGNRTTFHQKSPVKIIFNKSSQIQPPAKKMKLIRENEPEKIHVSKSATAYTIGKDMSPAVHKCSGFTFMDQCTFNNCSFNMSPCRCDLDKENQYSNQSN
ncbi:hypothetical protein TKK_0007442 [Trichogramma kaykai]